MNVGYCKKCKNIEVFSDKKTCSSCGGELINLGVTPEQWNMLSEEEMANCIMQAVGASPQKTGSTDTAKSTLLVPGICPQCGGKLKVDKSQEAAICEHCGTPFIVEKAINNYNTTINNNYNFAGANVVVQQGNVDNWIKLAESAINEKNYNEAKNYYLKVLEIDGNNSRALFGKTICFLVSTPIVAPNPRINVNEVCNSITEYLTNNDNDEFRVFALNACVEAYNSIITKDIDLLFSCLDPITTSNLMAEVVKVAPFMVSCERFMERNHLNSNPKYVEIYKNVLDRIMATASMMVRPWNNSSGGQTRILDEERRYLLKAHEVAKNAMMSVDPAYVQNSSAAKISDVERLPNSTYNTIQYNQRRGCYIATCVYGSYDCPNVWVLRRFRDYTLSKTWFGRLFIKIYYSTSPTIVKIFGDTKYFRDFCKQILDKIVIKLEENGVENTPYMDKP